MVRQIAWIGPIGEPKRIQWMPRVNALDTGAKLGKRVKKGEVECPKRRFTIKTARPINAEILTRSRSSLSTSPSPISRFNGGASTRHLSAKQSNISPSSAPCVYISGSSFPGDLDFLWHDEKEHTTGLRVYRVHCVWRRV